MTREPDHAAPVVADDDELPNTNERPGPKPRLLLEDANPDRTVADLRDILAGSTELYERDVPVRIAHDRMQGGKVAQVLSKEGVIMTAHKLSRPYREKYDKSSGELTEVDAGL